VTPGKPETPGGALWGVAAHADRSAPLAVASNMYFLGGDGIRCSSDTLAVGIDIRGVGGYVVGPGSSIGDRVYELEGSPQEAMLPDTWRDALLLASRNRDAVPDPGERIPKEQRNDKLFHVYARSLNDLSLTEEEIRDCLRSSSTPAVSPIRARQKRIARKRSPRSRAVPSREGRGSSSTAREIPRISLLSRSPQQCGQRWASRRITARRRRGARHLAQSEADPVAILVTSWWGSATLSAVTRTSWSSPTGTTPTSHGGRRRDRQRTEGTSWGACVGCLRRWTRSGQADPRHWGDSQAAKV